MSRRPLSDDERALWERVAREAKPLQERARGAARSTDAVVPRSAQRHPASPSTRDPAPLRVKPAEVPDQRSRAARRSASLMLVRDDAAPARPRAATPAYGAGDPRMDRQVRRKAIEVEDVIDLHGLNAPRARAALRSFLKHSYQEDRRLVLVVTGKGRGEGKGVIRDGFLQWIDEADIRPLVARAAGARPRHGGAGAFYVFLKRKRRDRKRPNRGLHRA